MSGTFFIGISVSVCQSPQNKSAHCGGKPIDRNHGAFTDSHICMITPLPLSPFFFFVIKKFKFIC